MKAPPDFYEQVVKPAVETEQEQERERERGDDDANAVEEMLDDAHGNVGVKSTSSTNPTNTSPFDEQMLMRPVLAVDPNDGASFMVAMEHNGRGGVGRARTHARTHTHTSLVILPLRWLLLLPLPLILLSRAPHPTPPFTSSRSLTSMAFIARLSAPDLSGAIS